MKPILHPVHARICGAIAFLACALVAVVAPGENLEAVFNSAMDVPVMADGYTATGMSS